MKKSIVRTIVLVALVFCFALVTSCKKKEVKYKITFELNGGSLSSNITEYVEGKGVMLPTPTKEDFTFSGWYDNASFSGSAVTKIDENAKGDKKYYAKWTEDIGENTSRWELNQIGFNGNGMKFGIKVLPVSEFDPTSADYSGDSKALKQAHLNNVEGAYNIDIEYIAYGDDEAWGPTRVKAINDSFLDGSYLSKNIYVVNISSQWIPTLVRGKSLAALYNTSTETGYFANAGYEQNDAINQSLTVKKNVYGYAPGSVRPDYFIYYNATKAALIGMEDPAELWLKGEWTWSKFDSWVKDAQVLLSEGEYAIDCGYAEFSIGAVAALGQQMIDPTKGRVLFTRSAVTEVFDDMQTYYKNKFWDPSHGVQDVATNFKSGKTLLHTGSLWFLKEATRFTPAGMDGGIEFQIGVVPYPIADNQEVIVHTEPYTYYDTEGNAVQATEQLVGRDNLPLTTASGDPIYGVDYSETTFQIPYTGGTCYSVMDYLNTPSGMNSEIAFNIMYDLVSGIVDDPAKAGMTADENYETYLMKKLDQQIDVDVIMSVQNPSLSYFELMEAASMTVGDGSHFGKGYWAFCAQLITGSDTPKTKLDEQEPLYVAALDEMGY